MGALFTPMQRKPVVPSGYCCRSAEWGTGRAVLLLKAVRHPSLPCASAHRLGDLDQNFTSHHVPMRI